MAYINDSDEGQEEDEDMLLACILVSEYLEEKEERPKFYCLGPTHCRANCGMRCAFQQL